MKYRLIITIFLIVLIISIVNAPYQSTDKYLEKNHADLNLKDIDDFSGLEILSEDIKDKKIIFAGEHHNLVENHEIEIKLLKYFQKEIGVNYILEEVGYADSHFLNKYLESGDEKILKEYFEIYKNQKYYTKERYNDYIEIYKLNQTLPKDEQIKVVGTDIESKATYHYIIDIVKDKNKIPQKLQVLLNTLKNFNYNSRSSFENIINILDKLTKDIENNEEKYINLFKEDIEGFKFVIKNLSDFSKACTLTEGNYDTQRDKCIYENFKIIDSSLENGVYFGQWGSDHILQDTFYSNNTLSDINYFASLLDKDPKYNGKILSINYGYYFEEYQRDINKSYIDEELFKNYIDSPSKATIFRLNNKKSPFKEKNITIFSSNNRDYKDNPTTNYFEYLILIRNSEKSKIVM